MTAETRLKLTQRRMRIRMIRRRIVATSLAIFALAWGVIFVQLVDGHDPSLSSTKTSTTAQTQKQTTTAQPAQQSPSPVTTSQS
jgi:hypothetical protein